MIGALGTNYQPMQAMQPPEFMAPVQNIAERLNAYATGQTQFGFDPLYDPSSRGYEATYAYNPKKWLFRYGVESTVGTQSGFANLKQALYGPSAAASNTNLPAWVQKAEKSFNHSQKLINFADKNLNNSYFANVHHNPFADLKPGNITPGAVPTAATQTTTQLYAAKALDHDELLAINAHEKARIAAIRKQYGWKTAMREAFHKNRLTHAGDVLTEGGKLSKFQGFKNYVSKTLIHREARWLTEPMKRGEVLASILRPLAMGLMVYDVGKTTKRAYDNAIAEGKGTLGALWDGAKTLVTKSLKSFATWSLGTIAFKAIALALGTAIGLPAVATSVIAILGAVGVGWLFNNLANKIFPDPHVVNEA